jgi:uncharacterized protein (DUF2461 family)
MNLQDQKAIVIEQFKHVNDVHLINAIKSMLDYALNKEQDNNEIPEAHQKLVMERFDQAHKDPDRLLDWNEAKKTLKT